MIPRWALRLVAMVAMVAFGLGVYHYLGLTKSKINKTASKPTSTKSTFALAGTLFLAQGGGLYSLHDGSFTELGRPADWIQPSLTPDGNLIAVKKEFNYSDLYELDAKGNVVRQLTHNQSPYEGSDVGYDYWSYYPVVAPDGTLFMSDDRAKSIYDYAVDFAVWSFPMATPTAVRQWTTPNVETGGDVQPNPTKSGGLLYTKYDLDADNKNVSSIMLAASPEAAGKALTDPEQDCSQPALSPDQSRLAMICANGQQTQLVLSTINGAAIGTSQVLISGTLAASPTWAPDGSGLVYLAPADQTGHFQLWWQSLVAVTPSPTEKALATTPGGSSAPSSPPSYPAPKQVTHDLDFDATSRPAWSPT
ncbi:MAG TPA: hypothetical protein VG015_07510 [Candidatus Dormibacteraeota bacterium]|jgi:Tol biopolymer transport system component|nr:hypothetical protein [Candidatus Dormibacteraeota bacterium]